MTYLLFVQPTFPRDHYPTVPISSTCPRTGLRQSRDSGNSPGCTSLISATTGSPRSIMVSRTSPRRCIRMVEFLTWVWFAGLSNCTLIRELFLAGNRISHMKGLHRLLKLTVLDLSCNKIATTKALDQLVANYNSLEALNLLANPVMSNTGEVLLTKAISGVLPRLAFLNKQPIKKEDRRRMEVGRGDGSKQGSKTKHQQSISTRK